MFFRSVLYNIFYVLWCAFCFVFFVPSLFSFKTAQAFSSFWAEGLTWGFVTIVGVKIEFEGRENFEGDEGCVLASKHQSAFETFYFLTLKDAAFVYKKELGYIPFFGLYHKALRNIAVDRKAGAKALKMVLKGVKERVSEGRKVVIFPEGTRVLPEAREEYKPAIYAIYKEEDTKIVPIALNSGELWQKNSFLKESGVVKIKAFPAMKKSLGKKEFFEKLRESLDYFEGKVGNN